VLAWTPPLYFGITQGKPEGAGLSWIDLSRWPRVASLSDATLDIRPVCARGGGANRSPLRSQAATPRCAPLPKGTPETALTHTTGMVERLAILTGTEAEGVAAVAQDLACDWRCGTASGPLPRKLYSGGCCGFRSSCRPVSVIDKSLIAGSPLTRRRARGSTGSLRWNQTTCAAFLCCARCLRRVR
jgi:hypothetical protein